MVNIMVRHTVADYAAWRPVFDAHEAFRRANGATGEGEVYRDEGSPNQVTTILEWDTAENARRFSNDPSLKEAMREAGVTGAPEIHLVNRA
jgi:hypothetical protein